MFCYDPSQPAGYETFSGPENCFSKKYGSYLVLLDMHTISGPSLLSEVLRAMRGNMHLFFHFSQQNVSVCMVDTIRTEILNEVVQL